MGGSARRRRSLGGVPEAGCTRRSARGDRAGVSGAITHEAAFGSLAFADAFYVASYITTLAYFGGAEWVARESAEGKRRRRRRAKSESFHRFNSQRVTASLLVTPTPRRRVASG